MARKLKYWGGHMMLPGTHAQRRTIVAVPSKAAAVALLPISMYEFNNYWSETGNAEEIEVLQGAAPGTVFFNDGEPYGDGKNYIKLEANK